MNRVARAALAAFGLTVCSASCHSKTAPSDCTGLSLTPGSLDAVASASAAAIGVNAPARCSWSAQSQSGWISITSGATGTGPGSIALSIASNAAFSPRNGVITVADQVASVTQEAASLPAGCSYAIQPTSRVAPAVGSARPVEVLTPPGCPFTVAANDPWITAFVDEANPRLINVAAAANPGPESRTGSVTIAFQTYTLTQDGTAGPSCTFALTPASATYNAIGGNGIVVVQTGPTCYWTLSRDSAATGFLTPLQTIGLGTTSITYTIKPNQSFVKLTGNLLLLGDGQASPATHQVTENGASCLYTVSPTEVSFAPAGGQGSFTVTTSPTNCQWTTSATATWITNVTASGTGSRTVSYRVGANSGAARNGEIVVAGLSGTNPPARFTIRQ